MKVKVLGFLQKMGRCFMLPISLLPIAGLFLGIGTSFTNPAIISSMHLDSILYEGTFLYALLLVLAKVGDIIFSNLPLIFAASLALGMSKKNKGVAVVSAVISFFVMHETINSMLILNNMIEENNMINGIIVNVCGIYSLEMGVFGGVLVGLGVAYICNRFYDVSLPNFLSFFEGERLIPILSTCSYVVVGLIMFYIWPFFQNGIFTIGKSIADLGYAGTFFYGMIERLLIPFGLHHVFYVPFWQTGVGGSMLVNGEMIYGGQNIFFAQLADPTVVHFSSNATKFFTGKFIIMMFGLPGAALAMYRYSNKNNKAKNKNFLITSTLTSFFTGITEPLEFSFLFAYPLLFIAEAILAGSAHMVAHMLNIAVGLTFSGGLFDFVTFGILQGNAKTNWLRMLPVGFVYFIIFYFLFAFCIRKYKLNIPAIEEDVQVNQNNPLDSIDEQSKLIVNGLGGRHNFSELDCCVTRLRAHIENKELVNKSILKQAGAAAIVFQGNMIQVIFGPKVSYIKNKLEEYLETVPETYDEIISDCNMKEDIVLSNIVDGTVLTLETSIDPIFSNQLLGDGIMIQPDSGRIVSPCDGYVSMIYPTLHALGLKLDNGCELLIHIGTNTVNLNGKGFEIFVEMNQKVNAGDILWHVDLEYIKKFAEDANIMIVLTSMPNECVLQKKYGWIASGEPIMTIAMKKGD